MTTKGTNFSTLYRDGAELIQEKPLDVKSPWVSKDGKITVPFEEVCEIVSEVGAELTLLQMSKSFVCV